MLCISNIDVSFNWGIVNQRSDKRRIGRANSGREVIKKGQFPSENCPQIVDLVRLILPDAA
ncbi:hypothetical protein DMI66_14135 [Escherichia coli]|nr:hypothetical protein [Escherichia coli]